VLLKRKIDRLEARRSGAMEKLIAERNLQVRTITDDDILRRFEDAAMELTWKQALMVVGLEDGLVDDTGRPLTARSRRILDKAKRKYTRARREFLRYRNAELEFQRLSAGDDQKL
jgi:hypothetical protein